MLGRRLYNYQIEELLGEGGMGAVYKATDTSLERTVAIKALHTHLTNDQSFLERFKNEARLAAKLSHPNLALVYNFIQEGNEYFIIMEYIQGIPLDEHLKNNKNIPIQESLQIIHQVLSGLGHAHQKHILHRDIKPGNIMILPDHQVKLMDFGIAKISGGTKITGVGKIIGTMEYMSPELIKGSEATIQSDLYAIGVTMYEMITGRTPFQANSEAQLLHQIIHTPVKLPDRLVHNIPDSLNSLLERLLSKDPDRRPSSAKELQLKISEIQNEDSNAKTTYLPSFENISFPKFKIPGLNNFSNASTARLVIGLAILASIFFIGIEFYFNSMDKSEASTIQTNTNIIKENTVAPSEPYASTAQITTNNNLPAQNTGKEMTKYSESIDKKNDLEKSKPTSKSTISNTNKISTEKNIQYNSPANTYESKPIPNHDNVTPKTNLQNIEAQPSSTENKLNEPTPKTEIVKSNTTPTKKTIQIPPLDVRVKLSETISSDDSRQENDMVLLEASSDVFYNKDLIISKGAEVQARITKIKPSGKSNSFLEIQIEKVKCVNGSWIRLKMIPLGRKGSNKEAVIFNKGVNISPDPKIIPQNLNI